MIAVIGLGGMGAGLAHRLLEAGHAVTVHNRTPGRAAPLEAAGARVAASPQDAVAGAEAVLLCLSDEAAVDAVLTADVLDAVKPDSTVVNTGTVSPGHSRLLAGRVAAAGRRFVESALLGNPSQARAGELRVLAAGDAADVERVRPVLEALGHQLLHLGPVGQAAAFKLVFNLLLGAQVASLAEAVAYGVRAGLPRDLLLTAVAASGFSSKVMAFRADIMRERTYEPAAFRAALMEKDLRLALAAAGELGVDLPVAARAAERFAAVVAAGDGDLDAAVLVELAERRPAGERHE
ncbi:NAD(P)-dependent oxidoreductase [Sphaerisporangium dianthi]|uniref:NAD(P)-dependent oxidoreductase n=1 Tax=Sphaerisporangium dianthi TaxID=1436120 RepID=A0ABV9CKH5_9ACTN